MTSTWSGKTEISAGRFIERLDITASKFYDWRVLSHAGLLSKWNGKPSKKGTGFAQGSPHIGTGTSMFPA